MPAEQRKNKTPGKISVTNSFSTPPVTPVSPQSSSRTLVSPERLHSRQWVLAGNEEQSLGNDASDNTKASPLQYHYPVARSVLTAATWFTLTAVILWCLVLPEATKWWTTIQTIQPTNATESRSRQMMNPLAKLPGNYQSLEEMNARHQRFPSIDQRVRVYMSNWYTPPCRPTNNNVDASFVQYNYLPDPTGKAPPLLVLQELVIPEDRMSSNDNGDVENDGADLSLVVADQRQYSHSGNNRTFLLDSQTAVTGAIIFYMSADAMRRCDQSACFDTVKYLFPSLHRIDMSVTGPTEAYTSTALHPKKGLFSYAGNALDAMDGNRNGVVPVILQFGDLEISRAYVPRTHLNETYPVTPVFKKFRMSLSRSELQRVITASCAEERQVPLTRTGDRHLQPIISKLTYRRHYGMLDHIPGVDIPWSEKKNGGIWRGALTGRKRSVFRVVQSATNQISKTEMCMNMQRCKLVYLHANSTLVNASLTGVMAVQPHTLLPEHVIPEVLDGVRLYGPHTSYADLLQYKAVIMLEGNDISSGLKWALYSNSVVLAQKSIYTSWAMEELLEPWVHYIPVADDLSDVEDKVAWVLAHEEEAQNIARAGSLWISDLIYHPDAESDEAAIFDETFRRYKQHFIHNPGMSFDRLLYTDP